MKYRNVGITILILGIISMTTGILIENSIQSDESNYPYFLVVLHMTFGLMSFCCGLIVIFLKILQKLYSILGVLLFIISLLLFVIISTGNKQSKKNDTVISRDETAPGHYLKSETQSNLLMSGKVNLIREIRKNGDTIYDDSSKKIIILKTEYFDDAAPKIEEWIVGQNDSVFLYFPFETNHDITFSSSGYETKVLEVNTRNIPNTTIGYNKGFEQPYSLTLIKGEELDSDKDNVVAKIYYNKENEYFDFKRQK